MKGDAGDRIDFVFRFTSRLKKDVRAFSGAVVFKDLFGDVNLAQVMEHGAETEGLQQGFVQADALP